MVRRAYRRGVPWIRNIPHKNHHGAGNGDLPMCRTILLTGTLLLGAGVALAQSPQEQVDKTQLAMKSNLTSAIALSDIARDKKPYDQAAVDKALAELDDVAKRFPSLFPESIKGLKPTKGEFYASPKVWTERVDFEAESAAFVKAVGQAKAKIKDVNSLKAEFPELNKACVSCHEKFRVKG
jgi:cytochrome c556